MQYKCHSSHGSRLKNILNHNELMGVNLNDFCEYIAILNESYGYQEDHNTNTWILQMVTAGI